MKFDTAEFKKWLDKLQQESWQLELIISGFAIYGLLSANDYIEYNAILNQFADQQIKNLLWAAANIAVSVLLINLIIHVILRGLWIGAIGLRYVSGDIDFDSLNYSDKFTSYLKKKVGSFDKFISKIENFCSVLFAISFLMIFYVIAFFALFSSITLVFVVLMELTFIPKIILGILAVIFLIIVALGTFLVFVDFIGQGILKKKKWTSKLYFPFYRLFSFLTLSFLYRPLVYNFLDNKFSRRLSLFIVPFYIVLTLLSSFNETTSNYLVNDKPSSATYSNSNNYEDQTLEKLEFIHKASIPSKIIQTPYLKVFVLFKKEMEDFIFEKNKALEPKEDDRGIGFSFFKEFKAGWDAASSGIKKDTILPAYLITFNEIYSVEIDGQKFESDFISSSDKNDLLGFETYVNIRTLSEGKHVLIVKGAVKENRMRESSKTIQGDLVTIPFWYYPEKETKNNKRFEH